VAAVSTIRRMWNPDLKIQVQRLEDRFFDYVLIITRKRCMHSRRADPVALAQIVGASTRIVDVMPRMRCTKCQAKGADYNIEKKPTDRSKRGTH
jgi:hypothetical protein